MDLIELVGEYSDKKIVRTLCSTAGRHNPRSARPRTAFFITPDEPKHIDHIDPITTSSKPGIIPGPPPEQSDSNKDTSRPVVRGK